MHDEDNRLIYESIRVKNLGNLFYLLKSIYKINQYRVYKNKKIINTNLMDLLISLPFLLFSYKNFRVNLQTNILTNLLSNPKFNNFNFCRKREEFYLKRNKLPIYISKHVFLSVIKLLKIGKYPWGEFKKVYVYKSGNIGKRLIVVPFFMDKVIQYAIKLILEVIYEPDFSQLNCSFGFRTGKSPHDAICKLISNQNSRDMNLVLEGYIGSLFSKPNLKEVFVKILSLTIKDKKFLDLTSYLFQKKCIEDFESLSEIQDESCFCLWNIYLHFFDLFIIGELNRTFFSKKDIKFSNMNSIVFKRKVYFFRLKNILQNLIRLLNETDDQKKIKTFIYSITKEWKYFWGCKGLSINDLSYIKKLMKLLNWENYYYKNKIKQFKFKLINYIKKINFRFARLSDISLKRKKIKYVFVRYAHNFVIVTSFKKKMLENVKTKIKNYLNINLRLDLDLNKTKIKDIKKKSFKFLGFELKFSRSICRNQQKLGGISLSSIRLCAYPDKKKIIDVFIFKGIIDYKKKSREIKELSTLHQFLIVKIFNYMIKEIVINYAPYINYPRKYLSRWIMLLRYSCYKTIAQKEHTKVKHVVKQYHDISNNQKTISVFLHNSFSKKKCILLTISDALLLSKQKSKLLGFLCSYSNLKLEEKIKHSFNNFFNKLKFTRFEI